MKLKGKLNVIESLGFLTNYHESKWIYKLTYSHETIFTTDPMMGYDVMSRGRHFPQLCRVRNVPTFSLVHKNTEKKENMYFICVVKHFPLHPI